MIVSFRRLGNKNHEQTDKNDTQQIKSEEKHTQKKLQQLKHYLYRMRRRNLNDHSEICMIY